MSRSFFKVFLNKLYRAWKQTPKAIRNVIITLLSIIFLLLSLLGAIFPLIPGSLFFLIALTLLASEFTWAESYKEKLFTFLKRLKLSIYNKFKGSAK
jgi:uncharacterized BrkB/YihY/UPF0761 family membrane protein